MILMNGSEETNQTTGGNVTEKQIPWSKLHEIADALGGKLTHITCVDHTGRNYKRIVIEYEEEN